MVLDRYLNKIFQIIDQDWEDMESSDGSMEDLTEGMEEEMHQENHSEVYI